MRAAVSLPPSILTTEDWTGQSYVSTLRPKLTELNHDDNMDTPIRRTLARRSMTTGCTISSS